MAKRQRPRKKRQYLKYAERSKDALLTAVDCYNRVFGNYKFETTLIMLCNAFELLGKAILLKHKKEIRKSKQSEETISAEKVLLSLLEMKQVDELQAETLMQIVSLRNSCVHGLLPTVPSEIQHHLLFFGCKFYRSLLEHTFPNQAENLDDEFISLSFRASTTYASQVQNLVSKLRRSKDGDKVLVWLLERGVRYVAQGEFISQNAFEKLYRDKKKIGPHLSLKRHYESAEMVKIVPVQAPHNYSADISLRKGSNKFQHALPVQIKKVAVEDDYPYFSKQVAELVGKPGNTNFVAAAARDLNLKGDPVYHCAVKISQKSFTQRYSKFAVQVIEQRLRADPNYNPMKKK